MKYSLEWLEKKTTKVGDKWNATVKDEKGATYENVTLWLKDWSDAMAGMEVEGELVIKQNGQYENKTLQRNKTYSQWKPKTSATTPAGIKVAQERKAEFIEKAQDNKELGIKVSSTMRMAVDLALGDGEMEQTTRKETIKFWRQWLWNEWDKTDKDFPPFN